MLRSTDLFSSSSPVHWRTVWNRRNPVIRIIVVAFLAAIFWHTVVATALP
jgi:hypothetical protein